MITIFDGVFLEFPVHAAHIFEVVSAWLHALVVFAVGAFALTVGFAVVELGEGSEIILHVEALGDLLVPRWEFTARFRFFCLEKVRETITLPLIFLYLVVALKSA